MNSRLTQLAERRAALVELAESQRRELARALAPWRGPLAVADQGVNALRYIARHKLLAAAVLGLLLAWRPRRALGWLGSAWLRKGLLLWRIAGMVKRTFTG